MLALGDRSHALRVFLDEDDHIHDADRAFQSFDSHDYMNRPL